MRMYLEELFSTLVARKNHDSTGALYSLGLGALEYVLAFCLGKRNGKVLGNLGTNTMGYRAPNVCIKIQRIHKRKPDKNQ